MRHWITRKQLALTCTLALGLAAASASAAPIMVDFSTNDVPGGEWQSVSRLATLDLITLADGTTIDFSVDSRSTTTELDASGSALAGTLYEPAVRDFYWAQYANQNTITMTIGELDPDTVYTLDVISAHVAPTGLYQHRGIFTLNGDPADSMDPGEVFNAYTDGWVAGEVLTWSDVSPNGNGELVLSITVPGNSNLYINGFVLVPEPASVALLAAGGMCLSRRRPSRQA